LAHHSFQFDGLANMFHVFLFLSAKLYRELVWRALRTTTRPSKPSRAGFVNPGVLIKSKLCGPAF
jgi:hypothetical protein